MEYVFGFVTKDGREIENLKTIGLEEELIGTVELSKDYTDCRITDTADIVEKYAEETDSEGKVYKFYEVRNHIKKVIQQNAEDIKELSEAIDDLTIAILGEETNV